MRATIVSYAQLQAHRALRGNPDTAELLAIIRALADDRRLATAEAVQLLREARRQVDAATAAELDKILGELENTTSAPGQLSEIAVARIAG
jgi:hypothetical protein